MADLCESLLLVTSAHRRVIDVGNYSDQNMDIPVYNAGGEYRNQGVQN